MQTLVELLCVVQLLPKLLVLLLLHAQIVLKRGDLGGEVCLAGHGLKGFALLGLDALHGLNFLLILFV